MIRKDRDSVEGFLTDEEFEKITKPFNNLMDKKLEEWYNGIIAYYVSTAFNMDVVWETSKFEYEVNEAIDSIKWTIESKKFDLNQIKKIMESEYKLKVTNNNPINIEKIQ